MGGCFSSVSVVFFFDSKSKSKSDDDSSSGSSSSASARVISVNGDLREYPIPFTVSQLLQSVAIRENNNTTTTMAINSNSSSSSYFVCNSDCLYYDDYIPALDSDEFLQPNQIYFLLPKTKLQYKLSASDMAALAVKATLALQNSPSSSSSSAAAKQYHQNKKKKTRISPVVVVEETKSFLSSSTTTTTNSSLTTKTTKTTSPPLISRSGSIRKLQRYSSKRAKMAVRSFRLRLTTIYEGSIL